MFRPLSYLILLLGLLGLATVPAAAEPLSVGGGVVQAGASAIRVQVQRGTVQQPLRQWRLPERRGPSQEPAAARGYTDGYQRGRDDGRDRDRYDPVGHGNYRSGDAGYKKQYGALDSYRNNYRAGFRQGYEDGYRDGSRGRR